MNIFIMATKFISHFKTLNRSKNKGPLRTYNFSVRTGSEASSLSSVVYVCHVKKRPFLYGVGSLGNISGGYSRLRIYLRGNYVQDMRNDWLKGGDAFRQSLHSYKK